MKASIHIIFPTLLATLLFACQEDIIIDTEDGETLYGIYGGITTEKKEHTITISKTCDFYSTEPIPMVSRATVSITDQTDNTLYPLTEREKGVYYTSEMAGVIGHTYSLNVEVTEDGKKRIFHATSKINTIPEKIDSVQICQNTLLDLEIKDSYKIAPYFQTSKERVYYLFKLKKNGVYVSDTLSDYSRIYLGDFGGLYYNGLEMKMAFSEMGNYPLGVYNLNQKKENERLQMGDTLCLEMYSIPQSLYRYISDIGNSMGSNPFMGSPTNVRTNIQCEEGIAVGNFYAASKIEYSFVIAGE